MEKNVETIIVILGSYRGYIGRMEIKRDTAIIYWGYIYMDLMD